MDALLLINPEHPAAGGTPLADIAQRARFAQGVVAYITAPAVDGGVVQAGAGTAEDSEDGEAADSADWAAELVEGIYAEPGEPSAPVPAAAPALVAGEDDLVLVSDIADAFDGVDDLAQGLHEMNVDRIVIGGVDVAGALEDTAMAALACNFEVVLLADSAVDPEGREVAWLAEAAAVGANPRPTRETWLRM